MIKRIVLAIAIFAASSFYSITSDAAAINTWKAYLAFSDIQQIVAGGNDIYVLASNNIYSFNKNDNAITTYDKTNGLSDTYIKHIAWNKSAKRLIIVYNNSNIDLMTANGDVINISDLYTKSMTEDKTINSITIDGVFAYLSTNFGIVKVNMSNAEISDSYKLDYIINNTAIANGYIYAQTQSNDVLFSSLTNNLSDSKNWTWKNDTDRKIFDKDITDYNTYYPIASRLSPGGPKYNDFGELKYVGNSLYTVNMENGYEIRACLQVKNGDNWTIYEDSLQKYTGHRYVNLISCDVDPKDANHVFAGAQTGLYEFQNGRFVKEYNVDNSPLQTASTVGNNNKDYVKVTGVKFDKNGNLWLANSISPNTSLLELTSGGEWISHHDKSLMYDDSRSFENMGGMMFDSNGKLWFSNNFYRTPALISYETSSNIIKTYTNFANQDGVSLILNYVSCPTEDKNGNLWFCTSSGPLYVPASEMKSNSDNLTFTQYKVPRNDGTNYADYLLNNIPVTSMAIDGANRKWFATSTNGVYLISADNNKQIYHFTSENSKLLSNNVYSIAIDGKKGEVFFSTERGLCSFTSDATNVTDEMTKDNVYAYPNPVDPNFTGLITITGLSFNADIKITTATGYLVNEGHSNGGSYTWDGYDTKGNRVSSGIYNVITAKSDGTKGTVCKIAIVR